MDSADVEQRLACGDDMDTNRLERIGKHITLDIEAESREEAERLVGEACEKLLANPIMERFEFRVFSAEEAAL